jgi:hypothetical protein
VAVEIMDWFHAGLLCAVWLDRKSGVTMAISKPPTTPHCRR